MEVNNNSRFNPRRYEEHLSALGKKILNVLIQKWETDQNRMRNVNRRRFSTPGIEHRKVMTFGEEPQLPSPILPEENNLNNGDIEPHFVNNPIERELLLQDSTSIHQEVNNHNDGLRDTPLVFNVNEQNLPQVPTSIQLIKTVDKTNKCTTINTVANVDKSRNRISDSDNRRPHDVVALNLPKEIDREDPNKIHHIDWDDMFDTELFSDATATNADLVLKQNGNSSENKLNIQFPGENYNETDNDTTNYSVIKHKITSNISDLQKLKRKTPLIIDGIPKKVKKVTDSDKTMVIFRKQKYTKAVNNWLDDVGPNNPVEGDEISVKDLKKKNATDQVAIEKAKEKSNKKVVQAQLANKDGVMKFSRPKADKKKTSENSQDSDNTPDDKAGKSNKEKKSNPKFVVPIKSQIPVKDVNYKVITVNPNNIEQDTKLLRATENKELVIVLVYSNGFSQLNKQHTEDSCQPEGFLISFESTFVYFKGAHPNYREILQRLLDSNKILAYEAKNLFIYLKSKLDLEIHDIAVVDAKIGGSLLDPDNPPENFSELQKLLMYTPQFTITTECVLQKTAWYTFILEECASKLMSLLMEESLWNVFVEIEMKLLPIIAEMERRGVSVDLQKLRSMEEILLTKMKATELECHKAAGKTFQINSTAQVRALIYDELQLDNKCNVKIKETIMRGAKSTSELMLRCLVSVHPLPKLILRYRHLHKAYSTFLTGIAQHVKDGIVRPTWVQTAAATGRIASNNPNLQAIPKSPFSLVMFPDDNVTDNQVLSIRSVYTPRPGYTLLAADFKHVECRVFAHASADTGLLDALKGAQDLFRALAAKWLDKPESEVSVEDRERTKRIVYASLYGAGPKKLMDILNVSYDQVLSVVASFNRTFPSLKSFGRSVVSRCERNGGRLSTLCGRARRFKHIASNDFTLKSQAERQAVNFVVQGSAADICKVAMVLTSERLRSHAPPVDGYLLLQIHDELVWEIRDSHLETAAIIIKQVMENCGRQCGLSATLPVAVAAGRNWGEMTEYTLPGQ